MTKDFREWRTTILETHEVTLRNAPAHCLERISRPRHGEKGWQLSAPDSPSGGDEAESLGETNAGRDHRSEPWRGESRTQEKDPGDLRRSPSGIQQRNEECTCVRNRLRPGRDRLKRLQETVPGAHALPGILSSLLSQAGNTPTYQQNEQGSQQSLASKAGNNQPEPQGPSGCT